MMAMALSRSEHILRPARVSTVALSLAAALLLNFLPWKDLRLVPDFVALVLTFWCVRQPRLVGLGVAWTIGLLVDAGNGVLLGQHALAYSLLAFLAIWLSRRILWFGPVLQALHVAIMLAVAQTLVVVVRIVAGDAFPGWTVYVSPAAGAVLWPVVSWLLVMPQRRLEREQTIGKATARFSDAVIVKGPAFADDAMNVPLLVDARGLNAVGGGVSRIRVAVDRNPVRQVLDFELNEDGKLKSLPHWATRRCWCGAGPLRAGERRCRRKEGLSRSRAGSR